MKYVVAVSGGVDSVVLLDMLSRAISEPLVVVHFDHGIREDSAEDALFVEQLAKRYGYAFETKREALGAHASEALARDRRYAFLREVSQKHNAPIVTAHHLDDLVETVAINIRRGTGWRGVAVFGSSVQRPLVDMTKQTLLQYANTNGLEWREDSTNAGDAYLRNKIRRRTSGISDEQKRALRAIHARQVALRQEIEKEAEVLVGQGPEYSRYLFTHLPTAVAFECLRHLTGGGLTRPQYERALHAIKTAPAGSVYEAGNGISFTFSTRHFTL